MEKIEKIKVHVSPVDSMTLYDLQMNLPWTIKYSRDYRANPQSHKDFSHAILHAQKALGKLAAMADNLDHRRYEKEAPSRYLADLVICALRMANTYPDLEIDLQEAVMDRIQDKNNVKFIE